MVAESSKEASSSAPVQKTGKYYYTGFCAILTILSSTIRYQNFDLYLKEFPSTFFLEKQQVASTAQITGDKGNPYYAEELQKSGE